MKSIEKLVPEYFTKTQKSAEKADNGNVRMEAARWTALDKHGEKARMEYLYRTVHRSAERPRARTNEEGRGGRRGSVADGRGDLRVVDG